MQQQCELLNFKLPSGSFFMLHSSTIRLLRFPFSFLLMPVFLFALAVAPHIHWVNAATLFVVLHFLIYPSSNGYNSYMDRDETPIGLLEHPEPAEIDLYYFTIIMDIAGIALSSFVSWQSGILVLVYVMFSRLYSYRGVRLKKYPIAGYLTVVFNQGALVFYLVYFAVSSSNPALLPVIIAMLLIGGFYPITQVYQHEADRKDGVQTISIALGIKGTFLWCAGCYAIAMVMLLYWGITQNNLSDFLVIQVCFIPVLIFFLQWVWRVWRNPQEANFKNTMRMNWLASACTNLAFIIIIIIHAVD